MCSNSYPRVTKGRWVRSCEFDTEMNATVCVANTQIRAIPDYFGGLEAPWAGQGEV
jgi:hypothetical protein